MDNITASGLVYLFGEKFVPAGGLLDKATLVHNNQTVSKKNLGLRLFEAAFVSLAEEGYISLAVEKGKALGIFTNEYVVVTKQKDAAGLTPSLERDIMEMTVGDPKDFHVQNIIYSWYGRDVPDPNVWLINSVIEYLGQSGYFEKEIEKLRLRPDKVHWHPKQDMIAPLAGEAEALRNRLESFKAADAALHKVMLKQIGDGIISRRVQVERDD
ncbi:MAG: hypothetical protein HYX86_03140 [Chloroflexi bacterium]|nr:hypothetical protein [Chloroflexota bacterium]